jgi:hypothetical protein
MYLGLNKFKNNQILLIKICHRFLTTTKGDTSSLHKNWNKFTDSFRLAHFIIVHQIGLAFKKIE